MNRSMILHLFFLAALTLMLNGCGKDEDSAGSSTVNSSDTASTDNSATTKVTCSNYQKEN